MKKKYLMPILCSALLLGCASDQINQITEATISEPFIIETITEETSSMVLSPELKSGNENNKLTQVDIDNICKDLSYDVFDCKDGSQIIRLTMHYSDFYYIRYMPPMLADGNHGFFRKLTPSYEVMYYEDGSVGIPLSINDSGDFRFVLKNQTIGFLNDEDDKFNQEYSILDYEAQEIYRLSLVPDRSIPEEELRKFLRNCVYNGNISVLDELYKLIPEEEDDAKCRLELASAATNAPHWSELNPYQPEIFYSENINLFPQREILEVVSESMKTGRSFEELGCEEIISNFDWEGVWKTVTLNESEDYPSEAETNGIYKYDLNGDGLMEILFLFPGGTMGNEFWEIVFLDEEGGSSGSISDMGMSAIRLHRYNQQYFFLYPIRDFNDREFLGWNVYTIDKNKDIANACVYYEKVGSEIVFGDNHVSIDDFYNLDWEMDRFIDIYKEYRYDVVGKEIEPDEEIWKSLQDPGTDSGRYGMLDINNDGIEDWTKVYMFFPTGRLPYYCNYYFVDGKTQELMDLSQYFSTQNYELCCLIPYQIEEKNYFIALGGSYGSYIVKLIEIRGMEPVEVHSWLVSIKKRIVIQVSPGQNF